MLLLYQVFMSVRFSGVMNCWNEGRKMFVKNTCVSGAVGALSGWWLGIIVVTGGWHGTVNLKNVQRFFIIAIVIFIVQLEETIICLFYIIFHVSIFEVNNMLISKDIRRVPRGGTGVSFSFLFLSFESCGKLEYWCSPCGLILRSIVILTVRFWKLNYDFGDETL